MTYKCYVEFRNTFDLIEKRYIFVSVNTFWWFSVQTVLTVHSIRVDQKGTPKCTLNCPPKCTPKCATKSTLKYTNDSPNGTKKGTP